MNKIQSKVLNKLLDAYEKSRTYMGSNKVRQSFSLVPGKVFPKYNDDAEYDFFCQVNESLTEMEQQGLVQLQRQKNGIVKKITLTVEALTECYAALQRLPRRQEQAALQEIIQLYLQQDYTAEEREMLQPLLAYLQIQQERIAANKNVEYFQQDMEGYRQLLQLVQAALTEQEEIFIRNLSIRLFDNSKRAEQLQDKAEALLYQYGSFAERKTVLEECGIVHTPTYVMVKGNGRLQLGQQILDLSLLQGDIALSTESMKELQGIEVWGQRVITVENLTSFHDYTRREDFVVYLGGFHNKVKRKFLQTLFASNPCKEYRHFGDIDAGGFYILEHLKRKTGIPFRSIYMDKTTLEQYREHWLPLTANDRTRLGQLLQEQKTPGNSVMENYEATITFMLEHNCKLEQEAVMIK